MNELLKKIGQTGIYENSRGEQVKIHSETALKQCVFLQDIIRKHQCQTTLEVGLAYGLSALAIVEEVAKLGGQHIVLEVGQKYWGYNGLDLLEQAGYMEHIRYLENYSYRILPQLLAEGTKIDFAYIDSTKLLDYLMVDYFFIDKMLKVGGFLVFDDAIFPSIIQLLRYIAQLPHYEVYATFPEKPSLLSRMRIAASMGIRKPKEGLASFFNRKDIKLGINGYAVALRKTGEDERNWDWHKKM